MTIFLKAIALVLMLGCWLLAPGAIAAPSTIPLLVADADVTSLRSPSSPPSSADSTEVEDLPVLDAVDTVPMTSPDASAAEEESEADAQAKPVKTYFLSVMPDHARRQTKIDPPATRMVILSESGDIAVRCGDGTQTYNCVPGNAVTITHEADDPITQIWAQNPGERNVRLRIDVLEEVDAS